MSVSTTIVARLAERSAEDPTDLPPLADTIDPGVLEQVVQSGDGSVSIDFSYLEYDVTVSGDGTIQVDGRRD